MFIEILGERKTTMARLAVNHERINVLAALQFHRSLLRHLNSDNGDQGNALIVSKNICRDVNPKTLKSVRAIQID